jgi:hypothetical protein
MVGKAVGSTFVYRPAINHPPRPNSAHTARAMEAAVLSRAHQLYQSGEPAVQAHMNQLAAAWSDMGFTLPEAIMELEEVGPSVVVPKTAVPPARMRAASPPRTHAGMHMRARPRARTHLHTRGRTKGGKGRKK